MFWKFVISILLLPSCLGLEIAAALEKNELHMLPISEELSAPVIQTNANQNLLNSLYSSVTKDLQADTKNLKHRKYRRHYHRFRRQYHQRYRNYYHERLYSPQNIYYRRRYHNQYINSHQGVYKPLYYHYLKNYDYLHRNFHHRCY